MAVRGWRTIACMNDKNEYTRAYRTGYEIAWSNMIRHIRETMKSTSDINEILKSLENYHDSYPKSYPLETIIKKFDELLIR